MNLYNMYFYDISNQINVLSLLTAVKAPHKNLISSLSKTNKHFNLSSILGFFPYDLSSDVVVLSHSSECAGK